MHNHDLKNKSKVFGTGKCKSRMEVSGTTLFRTTQEKKPYFTDHYPFSILFWNSPGVGGSPKQKGKDSLSKCSLAQYHTKSYRSCHKSFYYGPFEAEHCKRCQNCFLNP